MNLPSDFFDSWKLFIRESILNQDQIYLKGGNALGLYLATISSNNNLIKLFNDWDFCSNTLTTNNNHIQKYGGVSIDVYRYDNQYIELSVTNNISQSEMELPLSMIKLEITTSNIDTIFEIIESMSKNINMTNSRIIYSSDTLDRIMPKLLSLSDCFNVPHSQKGLFDIMSENNIDKGIDPISDSMYEVFLETSFQIEKLYQIKYYNVAQFLICHIRQPDRMFLRLPTKSIQKSIMMKTMGFDLEIMLDEGIIYQILNIFACKINQVLQTYCKDIITENLNNQQLRDQYYEIIKPGSKTDILFKNINIGRLSSLHLEIKSAGFYDFVKKMFDPLRKSINTKLMKKKYNSNRFIGLLCILSD